MRLRSFICGRFERLIEAMIEGNPRSVETSPRRAFPLYTAYTVEGEFSRFRVFRCTPLHNRLFKKP